MSKKKAIKIAAASAIAASTFAAVAPANADAAVNVKGLVDKAVKTMTKAQDTYAKSKSFVAATKVEPLLKQSVKDYNAAKAAVLKYTKGSTKTAYLAKLKAGQTKYYNAKAYVAAVKYAEKLSKEANELEQDVADKNIAAVKRAGAAKIAELNGAVAKIKKDVVGATPEKLVAAKYLKNASSIANLVNVYFYADKAEYWINKESFNHAEARLKVVDAGLGKVSTTSAAGKVVHAYVKEVKELLELKQDKVAPVLTVSELPSEVEVAAQTLTVTTDDQDAKVVVTLNGTEVVKGDAGYALTLKDGNNVIVVTATDKAGNKSEKTVEVKYNGIPKVESVSAINAKQLVVTFNKPIKKSSVIAAATAGSETIDTLLNGVFTINELTTNGVVANTVAAADTLGATLSANGKTLTITADTYFDGRYEVITKAEAIETTGGHKLAGQTTIVSVSDTVKPSVTGVTYLDNATARVSFSEPLSSDGTITAKYADGTSATVAKSFTDGNSYIELDLSALTANKDTAVTFVGVKDAAGNLINPNPVVVNVKKDTNDTVKPTVESITTTSKTTFDIKLTEAVSKVTAAPGKILIGSVDVTAVSTVDTVDPTVIHVNVATLTEVFPTGLSGLQTVALEADAVKDRSGNKNIAYSKVVNFDQDAAVPQVLSTSVETINDVQYLVVNYNEFVAPQDNVTLNGYYFNNVGEKVAATLVTDTDESTADHTSLYNADASGKSKSIKIDLSSLTAEDYVFDLTAGLVKDLYANSSELKQAVTFTKAAASVKQAVRTSVDANGVDYTNGGTVSKVNNELYVHFNSQLDISSATDKNNYVVEGATVEKAEIQANSAGNFVVKLTLANETVDLDGVYEVTVNNVKGFSTLAMDQYRTSEDLTENVRPTVTNAALTDNTTITLTFSEGVSNVNNDAGQDFELYVGSTKVNGATLTAGTIAEDSEATTVTLTLSGYTLTAQDLAAGLSVKATSTLNLKDANGNLANTATVTVR